MTRWICQVALEDALETYLMGFEDKDSAMYGGANNVALMVNEIYQRYIL